MVDSRLHYRFALTLLMLSPTAWADDDMNFLEDRPHWNLDTRVFADRDGGRGGLLGLGWDTDHGAKLDLRRTAFNSGSGLDSRQTQIGVASTSLSTWRLGVSADQTSYSDTLDINRVTPQVTWMGEAWDIGFAPEFSRLAFARRATATGANTLDLYSRAWQTNVSYFGLQDWMLSAHHYRATYSRNLATVTNRIQQLGQIVGSSRIATADGLVSGLLATRTGADVSYSWGRTLIGASYERAVSEADRAISKSSALSLDWQQNQRFSWSTQLTRTRYDTDTYVTISGGIRISW